MTAAKPIRQLRGPIGREIDSQTLSVSRSYSHESHISHSSSLEYSRTRSAVIKTLLVPLAGVFSERRMTLPTSRSPGMKTHFLWRDLAFISPLLCLLATQSSVTADSPSSQTNSVA